MRKTFCDICGSYIAQPRCEGYKLCVSNWQNHIPETDGCVQPPFIENLEMCERCAKNINIHIEVLQKRYEVIYNRE